MAYRRALREGDVSTLRTLSDEGFQSDWDEARLERWLKKNPRLRTEAQARLNAKPLKEEAVFRLADGETVRLVREGGAWRVAEGGLLTARFHTPEAALATFFFAATGHLELLRQAIPEEQAQRFASDYQLGKHLYGLRERIFQARAAIGPLREGMAIVEGDRATIPYGDGRAVDLVRQSGRWRVVDLE